LRKILDPFFALCNFFTRRNLKIKQAKKVNFTNFGGEAGLLWPFLLKKL